MFRILFDKRFFSVYNFLILTFDLQEDPGEVNDLWDSTEHAKLKADLIRRKQ